VGAALAVLAAALALHTSPPATHDRLPVFLGDRGPVYFDSLRAVPLASTLRVFHARSGLRDVLPESLYPPSADWDYLPAQSRLLVAAGRARLYGIPELSGGVCFYIHDAYHGYCVARLVHGAYPFVDARTGEAFGLLSDRAARVTVDGRAAAFGRNGFYVRASHVRTIVVTDHDGARHVYSFYPCEVRDYNDIPFHYVPPLDPLPDYCG